MKELFKNSIAAAVYATSSFAFIGFVYIVVTNGPYPEPVLTFLRLASVFGISFVIAFVAQLIVAWRSEWKNEDDEMENRRNADGNQSDSPFNTNGLSENFSEVKRIT